MCTKCTEYELLTQQHSIWLDQLVAEGTIHLTVYSYLHVTLSVLSSIVEVIIKFLVLFAQQQLSQGKQFALP